MPLDRETVHIGAVKARDEKRNAEIARISTRGFNPEAQHCWIDIACWGMLECAGGIDPYAPRAAC